MKGILVVRKYKNRRLYDTEQSRHITREELMEIVRSGRNVQIQEAKTGEDVTVETLLTVLLSETGRSLNTTIPSEFIHFLIRANQSVLSRFFRDFMPNAMQVFQRGFSELKEQGKQFAETMFPYSQYGTAWPFPMSRGNGLIQGGKSEVEDLRDRMKELEEELEELREKQ